MSDLLKIAVVDVTENIKKGVNVKYLNSIINKEYYIQIINKYQIKFMRIILHYYKNVKFAIYINLCYTLNRLF